MFHGLDIPHGLHSWLKDGREPCLVKIGRHAGSRSGNSLVGRAGSDDDPRLRFRS